MRSANSLQVSYMSIVGGSTRGKVIISRCTGMDRSTRHVIVHSLSYCDYVQERISTTPVEPFTRIRSPVLMRSVALDVPTTAGMANSRDTTAGCEVTPPASVTSPTIFVKRTTQAGLVIRQTRISPSFTWLNSSIEET